MKMGAHNSTACFCFCFLHLICKICMFIAERKTLQKYSQLPCRKSSSPLCRVCIPWAFFSSCSETSYPHLQKHFCHGSMSDSKAGCSLHSPPCLPIKLLSSQPPLPATCLASQLSFLKLWGSGWDPDHSPRSAACRAMPREDICLPLCGCLTVPLPRSQTTLSHSLTQLS